MGNRNSEERLMFSDIVTAGLAQTLAQATKFK